MNMLYYLGNLIYNYLHHLFSLFRVTCPTLSPGSTNSPLNHTESTLVTSLFVGLCVPGRVLFLCVVQTLNLCYGLCSCFSSLTLLAVSFKMLLGLHSLLDYSLSEVTLFLCFNKPFICIYLPDNLSVVLVNWNFINY